MNGNAIKTSIKGNRPSGNVRVSCLGKPTGPKPQRLLKKLPLIHYSFYITGESSMKFSIKSSMRWSVLIAMVTFVMACIFTVASSSLLDGVSWGIGMLIVIILIFIGVIFDILGLAAASANEAPFHGMASEKVKGSRQAIYIVRNADRFSNFCNDVIGDITSVISGAAITVVVIKLLNSFGHGEDVMRTVITVIFTAIVSALTVGGKAMGKSFAIHFSTSIVLFIGKLFYQLELRFRIRIFGPKRKPKSSNGKRGKNHARNNQSS
jgi:hypothetical protein